MNSDSSFLSKSISIILILVGAIFSALSIDYNSPIIAFVGLSLILWGGILRFTSPRNLIRTEILTSIYSDCQENMEKTIELYSLQKPVYIPALEIENIGVVNLVLDSNWGEKKKVKFRPPGLELLNYIEKESGINLTSLTIDKSFNKFKEIAVNELDLANKMEMHVDEKSIEVNIDNPLFYSTEKENKDNSKRGDPLISAIACLISKNLGEPLVIEEISYEKGEKINIKYKILSKHNYNNSNTGELN